jgi:hypothetical protein
VTGEGFNGAVQEAPSPRVRPGSGRDRLADGRLRGHHRQDLEVCHEGDVVEREDVGRIRHRQREGAADPLDREHLVLLRDVDGDQPERLSVDVEVGQGDGGDAVLAGQEADQLLFADEAQANEDRSELVGLALLLGQGLTQLLFLDEPLGDEEVAEASDHMLPEFHLGHSELLL